MTQPTSILPPFTVTTRRPRVPRPFFSAPRAALASATVLTLAALATAQDQPSAAASPAPAASASSTPASSQTQTQDPASLDLDADPRWIVRFEPNVWVPALRGDVSVPSSSSIDVEDIGADENEPAPAGRITIRADRFRILFRGFAFSLDETAGADRAFTLDGVGIAAGDRVNTDLSFSSFDAVAGYELFVPIDDKENDVRLAFDIIGGVRVTSIDLDLSQQNGGASSGGDNVWALPIIGGRMALDLPRGFGLDLTFDGGGLPGDDDAFTWDITVAFSWMATNNLGVEIGFRHLDSNLSDGDGPGALEFDAALAGLFGAVVIRF